jgi:hypothetical protein
MLPQLYDALIPTLIVLFIFVCIAYFLTARRIVSALKTDYHAVWVSLGCPEAIDSLMYFRSGVFSDRPASGRSLNNWFSTKGYAELNSPALTVLAPRLGMLRILGAILIALIAGSYSVHQRT